MSYPYPWPIGTVHADELPPEIYDELTDYVVDDAVSEALPVHRTPTEGPYVMFSGYKVRVTIELVSEDTMIVRLA